MLARDEIGNAGLFECFLFLQAAIVFLWSYWIFLPFLRLEGATVVGRSHPRMLMIYSRRQAVCFKKQLVNRDHSILSRREISLCRLAT
jgi:hypothetical protein